MTVVSYEHTQLEWEGDHVVAEVLAAAAVAIDYTMVECVKHARKWHDYSNRTGHMEMSTTIFELAEIGPMHVRGSWGAAANYSLFLEIGTSRTGPTAEARAIAGHGDMWAIPPPLPPGRHTDTQYVGGQKVGGTGPLMEPRMSLRPAAEAEYPMLRARIMMAFAGETLV